MSEPGPSTRPGRSRALAIGCAIAIVLPALACLGVAVVQPSTFRIARSRELAVAPEALRSLLTDVERLEGALAIGERRRQRPVVVLSPQRTGVGAYFERTLPGERTRFTLAELGEDRVVYDVDVGAPASSRFVAELAPAPRGTALTIAMEGRLETFVQRVLWPVVDLDGRIGPELEQTLEAIARATERTPGS